MSNFDKTRKYCDCSLSRLSVIENTTQSDFVNFFDTLYLDSTYDKDLLTVSLAKLIDSLSIETILDCAAGTGFPSLNLRKLGYNVDCSDNDICMIKMFQQTAAEIGTSDAIDCLSWADMHNCNKQYDLVMCRGNSLIYDNSWGPHQQAARAEHILHDLTSMTSRVKTNGCIYIDISNDRELGKSSREINNSDDTYYIHEEVQLCNNSRHWQVVYESSAARYVYNRWSSDFSLNDLKISLLDNGFSDIRTITIVGERPNLTVLLAKKTG